MGFQVSPGVQVREFDLTTVVPAVDTTVGAYAGVFRWGPVGQRVLIDSEQNLARRFGTPTSFNAEGWLARATSSAVEALRRFAQGLRDDYAAVKAGVTVSWSNGPVEGHINRLKRLKRHMFGRAHLDLLSRRFVGAPGRTQAPGREQPAPVATHTEAAAA